LFQSSKWFKYFVGENRYGTKWIDGKGEREINMESEMESPRGVIGDKKEKYKMIVNL